jgi:Melibiase
MGTFASPALDRRPLRVVEPAAVIAHPGGWHEHRWPATGAELHEHVGLRIPHAFRAGEPYVREGWQSWSTPTSERVGTGVRRLPARRPQAFGRRHWLEAPPYRGDESYGIWRSATATVYAEPGATVFVSDEEGLLAVREERADGRHPAVWSAARKLPGDELAARLRVARRPAVAHVGWSTWDAYGPALDADDLLDDTECARDHYGDTIELVLVDDGWQRVVGDWRPRSRRMAHALGVLGERHALGLWWAPFVVHREAALAAEHPDWIVRDADGAPVVVLARAQPWEAWALDLTQADVLGWLTATARRLAAYGASVLKCDFLYAAEVVADAARAGRCADTEATGEEILARALSAISAGGPELIGCGAPLWPAIGLVDLMRVGPDVGRVWRRPPPAGLEPAFAGGCLANAWAAARARAWMHDTLWLNDPDSVYLRPGRLTAAQADDWLDWVAGHGLPLVLGDPLRTLTREQRRRWERAVARQRDAAPPAGRSATRRGGPAGGWRRAAGPA